MFFTEKNFFYREKYKWKCKQYIFHFRNIFLHKKCLCYKWNINLPEIYIHSTKKDFLIIENIFAKTSFWTQ